MKKLAVLLSVFLFTACASQHAQMETLEPPVAPEPTLPANAAPNTFAPIPGTATLADYYKILVDQESSLAPLKKDGTKIETPSDGYLRAVAPTMTRGSGDLFAIFPGSGRDLVVLEARRCSPECSYAYTAYEFSSGSYKQLLFSSFLPKEEIEKTARATVPHGSGGGGGHRRHHKGSGNGSLISGWPRAEHMRVKIPAKSDSIPLYVLREVHSKRREDVTYYDIGTLQWQKGDFHFAFSPRGKAKALGKLDAY